MDKEYCGLRTSNVKASSRGGRSRKGNPQKPKKAHSRRSCYGTNDASLSNTEMCRRSSDSKRCVRRSSSSHYDAKADERRAKSRAKNAAKRGKLSASLSQSGGKPVNAEGVKVPSMEYCKVKPDTHTCVMTNVPEEQSDHCLHNLKTRRCIYYDPELGDDVFQAQHAAREAARARTAAAKQAKKDARP